MPRRFFPEPLYRIGHPLVEERVRQRHQDLARARLGHLPAPGQHVERRRELVHGRLAKNVHERGDAQIRVRKTQGPPHQEIGEELGCLHQQQAYLLLPDCRDAHCVFTQRAQSYSQP